MTDTNWNTLIIAAGGLLTTMASLIGAIYLAKINNKANLTLATAVQAAKKVEEVAVKAEEVAQKAQEVAVKTEEVKTTLVVTTAATTEKLGHISDIAEKTHMLVNSQMGAQLKLNAELSRWKADTTGKAEDIEAAEKAEHIYSEHQCKQDAVDNQQEQI